MLILQVISMQEGLLQVMFSACLVDQFLGDQTFNLLQPCLL